VLRRASLLLVVLLAAAHGFAEVEFSELDLSSEDQLLFRATLEVPGEPGYSALFRSDVEKRSLEQLTYYPESLSYLNQTGQIQLQNHFGVFRSDQTLRRFEPIPQFPGFVTGRQVEAGKITPIRSSPDGRYIVYIRSTSAGYGRLILGDLREDTEYTVSNSVEFSLSDPPVRWSPDSQFFVYSKGGSIYYYSIQQLEEGRLLDEGFRRLAEGTIDSAQWSRAGELFYISGFLVYRVLGVEFFARSLYQELLSFGSIAGKLPFAFDPNFDRFWISPDGNQILLSKGGRNLFLYLLQNEDYLSTGASIELPYLLLPRNTRVRQVVWNNAGDVTLLTGSIRRGAQETLVYRLDTSDPQDLAFRQADHAQIRELSLSPDGRSLALVADDEVTVRAYDSWRVIRRFPLRDARTAVWIDSEQLIIAGGYRGLRVSLVGNRQPETLFLSQAETFGFLPQVAQGGSPEEPAVQVVASENDDFFRYEDGVWQERDRFALPERRVASNRYRVYLETLNSGIYRNIVMVRNIQGVDTTRLFLPPARQYEAFPEEDEPINLVNFDHGSRIRRREVAFAFNAVSSVEGLTEILNVLAEYGVQTTFFVNGDFIRQHPDAVREIAESGHEVGSLFYTHFNMTDSRYQITEEFIQQGLARNEDEYFEATGRELSLIWHAPYYFVSPLILEASGDLDYVYIGRDVDSLDWVPRLDESGISRLYEPASQIVERVLEEKKPGSIVSMTIGRPLADRPYGGRDDYLFQRLDVLINRLIERGYSVVPVSTLLERVQ
jgi:peptidoglycan/xylan/chitin deacetylase (PgdA/CDA1 family)/WD40 repeat protein